MKCDILFLSQAKRRKAKQKARAVHKRKGSGPSSAMDNIILPALIQVIFFSSPEEKFSQKPSEFFLKREKQENCLSVIEISSLGEKKGDESSAFRRIEVDHQ
eukprot:TRINITY_DN13329_c0_g1_i7.p1 TRINITY_DN13329_c0_g1~~TRINITY_DN13329_c0_g1_i7.p1  ORF type:complete len:102 (+),score=26.75 TRINITY_DN13329_c0_g1_i7:383-688(+)